MPAIHSDCRYAIRGNRAAGCRYPIHNVLLSAELKYYIICGLHKLKLCVFALLKFCLPPGQMNYTFYHIQLACHYEMRNNFASITFFSYIVAVYGTFFYAVIIMKPL